MSAKDDDDRRDLEALGEEVASTEERQHDDATSTEISGTPGNPSVDGGEKKRTKAKRKKVSEPIAPQLAWWNPNRWSYAPERTGGPETPFLRALWRVEQWYVGEYPIYPVVAIRFFMGFWLFTQYWFYLPWFSDIWGPEGVVHFVKNETTWVMENHMVLFGILVTCAFFYMVGFMTRLSGLIAIAIHIGFHYQTWTFAWGDGTVGHLFIAYTLLGNPGGRFSVDAWLRKRRNPDWEPPTTCAATPVRLLQLHTVAIYFMAAYNRLYTKGWWAGRMTFVALEHNLFSRFPNVDFYPYRTLAWLGTWATWLIELGAPVLLWVHKTRMLFWFLCFAMHFGLEASSTIGSWQVYMMTVLTVWMPLEWPERFVKWAEAQIGLDRHFARTP